MAFEAAGEQAAADNGRKRAHAVRVGDGSIRLDGRLDEEAWRTAPALTEFVQQEPVEGEPATDAMEIRFVYDDDALYIGARMSSSAPVQAPLGRRDDGERAEHLMVSFDTHLDRRTAYSFGVTAAGVRLDEYFGSDDNDWRSADEGFDPVWHARTAADDRGWTAELWIPFSQLRFNDRSPQVWGLNVQRWVPSRNEQVYWALVPRTERGWASRFGDLHGIDGIRPSRRLELLPYAAGSSQVVGGRDRRNPFDGGANLGGRVGLDMKVGLGPNLTLEATANPDFGQVEADPAEVNLSAFETFFDERRPFFIERSQLIVGNVNNYFYSRRIGARPSGRAEGDFVDYPARSTILGAAKLTGRLASGTSIGVLGAVTTDEFARAFIATTDLPGGTEQRRFDRVRVAPQTIYGVARVEQEFGSGGSTWSVMTTAVHRNLEPGSPLAALLTRNAFTLSGDSVLRLNDGEYEINAFTGISYVEGEAPAITRVQRGSARYLQRPDVDYLRYDPRRTSLSGTKSGIRIERRNGRHWLWQASSQIESPEFETNDLGRFTSGDGITGNAEIEYRETLPGRWYRNYSLSLGTRNDWTFGGVQQERSASSRFDITWPNFWFAQAEGEVAFRAQDARLTRGGPSMQTPRRWAVDVEAGNNRSSQTRVSQQVDYGRDEDDGLQFEVHTSLSLQPAPQWTVSIEPSYSQEVDTQQYITTRDGGRAATFGGRYIFARIDRSTWATEVRLSYTFRPELTLDFYAEPFAASGRYSDFGELAAASSRLMRRYGDQDTTLTLLEDGSRVVTDGAATLTLTDRDFNVESFRSNLVLKWEWRPGSTLYAVWQQNRSEEEAVTRRSSIGDMFSSPGARGDNFFAVKASFWIAR
ncbi:MAG: DUF5916 domain-containing protein [Acidobacteriota bacterium]